MLFAFVLDTSASMARRFHQGLSGLDASKAAVEYFVKMRLRDPNSRNDRFFLVTYDRANPIVASWRDNTFNGMLEKVKHVQLDGPSSPGMPLAATFDLLNLFRMHFGIDNLGMGRLPSNIDPAMIIVFSDGGAITTDAGVAPQLILPPSALPGRDLYVEPFRWDQRIFNIVLAPSGTSRLDQVRASAPLTPISDVTGGRTILATSVKNLMHRIDTMLGIAKLPAPGATAPTPAVHQTGIVVDWEEACIKDMHGVKTVDVEGPPGLLSSVKKMIYVSKSGPKCSWPIPEAFNVDSSMTQLPKRTAHPVITFVPIDLGPLLVESFPFDKYEIEACNLTEALLQRPAVCWHVFIKNSLGDGSLGRPFGYLKSNTSKTAVNLFIMPYNFPELLEIIQQIVKDTAPSVTKYRERFDSYLSTVPLYYHQYIKGAFKRSSTLQMYTTELPTEAALFAPSIINMLRKLKQTVRSDFDPLCYSIYSGELEGDIDSVDRQSALPLASETATSYQAARKRVPLSTALTAPVDIDRRFLLDTVASLRQLITDGAVTSRWLHQSSVAMDDDKFNVPITTMGEFLTTMQRQEELRDALVDETQQTKKPYFGNPFRNDKRMFIDEADEAGSMSQQAAGAPTKKRSRLSRLSSKSSSPGSSPMSSPMVSPTSSAGVPPPEFILDMPPDLGIDNIVMPPDSPMGDLPVMPMDLDDVPIPLVPSPPPPQAMAQADTFEETEDTLMKSSEGMPSSPAAASTTTVDGEVSDTEDSLANEALVQALHIACASARRLVRTPGQHTTVILQKLRSLDTLPASIAPVVAPFLQSVIDEARRFKRRGLVATLQREFFR